MRDGRARGIGLWGEKDDNKAAFPPARFIVLMCHFQADGSAAKMTELIAVNSQPKRTSHIVTRSFTSVRGEIVYERRFIRVQACAP